MSHVVLTGFMGSGKTAVGRRLAKRLDRDFIDTDRLIEETQGRSIAKIFETDGEAEFRRIERETIEGLDPGTPSVISTGGGTFVDERNRKALSALGVVVCLVSSVETILGRIRNSATVRPLAQGRDADEKLARLLDSRMPYYRMADVLVETDGLGVEQATGRVLEMIRPRLRERAQGGGAHR